MLIKNCTNKVKLFGDFCDFHFNIQNKNMRLQVFQEIKVFSN